MNTVTKLQKEQLVQGILAIQREEWDRMLAEWKAQGIVNRARLRQYERIYWQKAEAETRRLVDSWYAEPSGI